ncbi:MAG: hypothetical protein ACI3XR_08050 [Eubacteriales bacterium]
MELTLLLAGLRLGFLSERPLRTDATLNNFICPLTKETDVTVRISWDWDQVSLPDTPPLGEDLLCTYHRSGEKYYCLTRGGMKGPIACCVYQSDHREFLCVINEKPFLSPPEDFGSILRMIPLRGILQRFGVLFLHSSRIRHGNTAILFTAPSGTGKTTQARLWETYRGSEVLCNDRTLLRKTGDCWQSYGFPLDGSEPVRSNAVVPTGAVVLLAQGSDNRVQRLRPAKAAGLLMSQAVIDGWNPDARQAAMEEILTLLTDIPVYLLTCTPDARAVECLESRLKSDGVIIDGR